MAIKRARVLNDKQFDKLWKFVEENSTLPERDHLILALSFKAGLRVAEIQKIDLSAMLDAEGAITDNIHIFANVGKKKNERDIPMHALVHKSLALFMKTFPNATFVAISSQPFRWRIARGEKVPKTATFKRMSVTALTNYYWLLLHRAGFEGASSHSGRRTFGTKTARVANLNHCSLRDVQNLMGHRRLETTEQYIDVSEDVHALVAAI